MIEGNSIMLGKKKNAEMHTNNTKQLVTDYFLLVFLIAVSGIPFFSYTIFWIVGLAAALVVAHLRNSLFLIRSKTLILYTVIFTLIILFQAIQFSLFSITTFVGFIIKTTFAFLVISLLDKKILTYFVQVIVVISLISFFFWLPNLILGQSFEQLLSTGLAPFFKSPFYEPGSFYREASTIIIYTFNSYGFGINVPRNSGAFWEPGAFAGMIIMALIFDLIQTNGKPGRNFLILTLALVTTFSTTGYVTLGFIMLSLAVSKARWYVSVITIPVILLIFTVLFTRIPFLESKIRHQLRLGVNDQYVGSRFVNAQRDFKDFGEYPIFGRGQSKETRFDTNISELMHRNNGVTDFLVKWGITGFFIYFLFVLNSFYRICDYYSFKKYFALVSLVTIWLIGFSEIWFNKPFFMGLVFLGEVFRKSADE